MTSRTLVLGTRGSDLALWQARRVAQMVENRLGMQCSVEIIKTRGDRIQDVAFRKMEGKGFFTKELQEALLEGRVDLVVHSLKDLPTEEPPGLELIAIPERANPADLLLIRSDGDPPPSDDPLDLPEGTILGTSSLRRAAQALARTPGIQIRALRGNVPTRIQKLRDGDFDAILLAAAGVSRLALDLEGLLSFELPYELMLPAPGQGALAIETRAGDGSSAGLRALHDEAVARCVKAERHLLSLLGGGCHLPLGCLATADENGVRLQAVLGAIDDEATEATIARVGGAAADPETAAGVCFEALRLALPEVATS